MTKLKTIFTTLATTLIFPGVAFAQNVVGPVTNPYTGVYASGTQGQGLFLFFGNVIKLVSTIAGIYFVIQLIFAGYTYISANGNEKMTAQAWAMIWQSLLGMVIIASAFVIASVVERFTGIKIITPKIYGPT